MLLYVPAPKDNGKIHVFIDIQQKRGASLSFIPHSEGLHCTCFIEEVIKFSECQNQSDQLRL